MNGSLTFCDLQSRTFFTKLIAQASRQRFVPSLAEREKVAERRMRVVGKNKLRPAPRGKHAPGRCANPQPWTAALHQRRLATGAGFVTVALMAHRKKKHARGEPKPRAGDDFPERGRGAGVRACGLRRRLAAGWHTRTGTVPEPRSRDGRATSPRRPCRSFRTSRRLCLDLPVQVDGAAGNDVGALD